MPAPRHPLKTAIAESGWHAYEVARFANIWPTQLSAEIHGKRPMSDAERHRVAQVLHRGVAELFPAQEYRMPPRDQKRVSA